MDVIFCGLKILDEISSAVKGLDETILSMIVESIKHAGKVFLIGAGRSRIILDTFCMRLNHLGVRAFVVGDLYCPPIGENDFALVVSGSGETQTISLLTSLAKNFGSKVCVVTGKQNSSIGRMGDSVLLIEAPTGLVNKEGSQLMRSVFEQTTFIICEAIIYRLSMGLDPSCIAKNHANLE